MSWGPSVTTCVQQVRTFIVASMLEPRGEPGEGVSPPILVSQHEIGVSQEQTDDLRWMRISREGETEVVAPLSPGIEAATRIPGLVLLRARDLDNNHATDCRRWSLGTDFSK